MNQQDAGRLAIGVVLGVVGAVAITKSGLSPRGTEGGHALKGVKSAVGL